MSAVAPQFTQSPGSDEPQGEAAEKRAIEAALLRHRHRLNEAAADLNISRVTLYRLMGQHGLREMSAADEKAAFAVGAGAQE